MATASLLWPRLAGLPLVVESCQYDRLHAVLASDFTRVTTHVRLIGAGADGLGEDLADGGRHLAARGAARAGARGRVDAGELLRSSRDPRPVREAAGVEGPCAGAARAFQSAALDLAADERSRPARGAGAGHRLRLDRDRHQRCNQVKLSLLDLLFLLARTTLRSDADSIRYSSSADPRSRRRHGEVSCVSPWRIAPTNLSMRAHSRVRPSKGRLSPRFGKASPGDRTIVNRTRSTRRHLAPMPAARLPPRRFGPRWP